MAGAKKSSVVPFVMAGLLGIVAIGVWLFAVGVTSSAPAACNNTYSVFAEMPACRWPAIFIALGWIAFISAIASGWVGGVRMRRKRTFGDAGSRSDGGSPPHDAHPST
jgi:hypothetical protein